MKYRALDSVGDYTMGKRSATLLTDTDAVAQAVYTRLRLWQGEWWEDRNEGLPMMQRILGFRNTQQAADILIRDRIVGTTDVSGMVSFESTYDPNTRNYSCTSEVTTKYGNITLNEGAY